MSDLKIDCIVAIDPGVSGGLAIWSPNCKVEVKKMPKDLMDLKEYFEYLKSISESVLVFIEKVQLHHGDMGNDVPGKAFNIQKMLQGFEKLKVIIEVCEIPFLQVHPMSWQSYLKLRKRGEEKQDRKNRYKAVAQNLYPEIKATLWNSDALLIMHFGRKKKMNDASWILENLPSKLHSKIEFS
jgi:hypothetical protein